MSTEDAQSQAKSEPPRSCSCHPDDRPAACQKRHALSACKTELTIVIPATVLEWCVANPEAAKGLASGKMVAVPRVTPARIWDDELKTFRDPPAPSGKAQGDDATEETPSWEVDRVLGKNVGAMK